MMILGLIPALPTYVFTRNQGDIDYWGEVKKLTASDGSTGDDFGWSVSISGNTIAIEAAYIFGNHPPVANDDSYTTNENSTLVVTTPGVMGNDNDPDMDTITATLSSPPTLGSLDFQSDGSFVYTLTLNFNGFVTYTYVVSDGLAISNSATVSITIGTPNNPPVAADDGFTVAEDSVDNPLDVLANDTDTDLDTLAINAFGTPDQGGTVVNDTKVVTDTPATDFFGTEVFTYTITDGNGGFGTSTATTTVTNTNNSPVIQDSDLSLNALSILENETVTLSGSFYDSVSGTHTVSIECGDGMSDTLHLNNSFTFNLPHTYLDDDPSGTISDIYTITVSVEDGVIYDSALVNLRVDNVPPSVDGGENITTLVNTSVDFLGQFTDPGPLDNHSYFWDFGDNNGTADIMNPTHIFTTTGTFTGTLTVTDDDGGICIDIFDVTIASFVIHLPIILR